MEETNNKVLKDINYCLFILIDGKRHYKCDSVWTTSTNIEDSKYHLLDNGKLQKHILTNLEYILNGGNKEKYNNMLIGYEHPKNGFYKITNKVIVKYDKYEIIEFDRESKLKRILKERK